MNSPIRHVFFLPIIALLLMPFPASAQSTRQYRLRPVSADEYIQALLTLPHGNDAQSSADFQNLRDDFVSHYLMPDPTISFASVEMVYRAISNPSVTGSDELAMWNSALISAFLKEHPIDLDHASPFGFDLEHFPFNDYWQNYKITAEPRDFKGDGGHEWLLTLAITEKDSFSTSVTSIDYLWATRDGQGGYHVLTFPLPWVAFGYSTIWDKFEHDVTSTVFWKTQRE